MQDYKGLCYRHYNADKQARLLGTGRVDAAPVAEHIAKLQRKGMMMSSISRYSGVSVMTIYRVAKQSTVNADTAGRILRIPV